MGRQRRRRGESGPDRTGTAKVSESLVINGDNISLVCAYAALWNPSSSKEKFYFAWSVVDLRTLTFTPTKSEPTPTPAPTSTAPKYFHLQAESSASQAASTAVNHLSSKSWFGCSKEFRAHYPEAVGGEFDSHIIAELEEATESQDEEFKHLDVQGQLFAIVKDGPESLGRIYHPWLV